MTMILSLPFAGQTISHFLCHIGLHAFGWSRQKAVQYLLDKTPLSERAIKSEVDRYISIPGQATTYKVGERNIHMVKEKAMKELGDQFDLAEFHRVVVRCFGPLSVLESCVDTWVTQGGGDQWVSHGHELDYTWDNLPANAKNNATKLGYDGSNWRGWSEAEDKWWEDLTTTEREAAEALGWCINSWNYHYEESYWSELPQHVQEAASKLGFTQTMWDDDEWPESTDKWWSEFSEENRKHLNTLGYSAYDWE